MASKGLRSFLQLGKHFSNSAPQNPYIARMSTIASFKVPKVTNEPNVRGASPLEIELKLT
jgi:hypothetical protein